MNTEKTFSSNLLSSLTLKIIACILMTLDHIALLFFASDTIAYEVLRSIGKLAFPIFAYLAYVGTFKTKNILHYLLRLLIPALLMDIVDYILIYSLDLNYLGYNILGNAFMDMFLGVFMLYFLNKRNLYSLIAIIPFTLGFLSSYPYINNFGTIIKSDWGFFSTILFLSFFIVKLIKEKKEKQLYSQIGIASGTYDNQLFFLEKALICIAIFSVTIIFYLLFIFGQPFSSFLPESFIPYGTYIPLASIFIIFASPKKGYHSNIIQYSFYVYYPLHIGILALISYFLGILSTFA